MQVKYFSVLRILLVLYVIACGFTDVLDLPGIGSKLQIPDIVFIPLFILWLSFILNGSIRLNFTRFDLLLAAYIFVAGCSMLMNAPNLHALSEVIGLIYLFTVYTVFRTSFQFHSDPVLFLIKALLAGGIIASVTSITGWILSEYGIPNALSMPEDIRYPYFGYVSRATGFMTSPNMLFNFIGVVFLFYLPQFLSCEKKRVKDYLILIVLAAGALFTFSKSILFLMIGILTILAYYNKARISKGMTRIISLVLFLVCMLGAHIMVRKHAYIDYTIGKEKAYTLADPFFTAGKYEFYFTNYTVNKVSTLRIGSYDPVLGIGPGMFNTYVELLRIEGLYPEYFINFDPHSTYFGAYAELGVAGLIVLLLLIFTINNKLKSAGTIHQYPDPFFIGILSAFIFFGLEAFNMDVLNFRHLWLLFALLFILQKSETKTSTHPESETEN